ncbi:MAG: branched-chain amino acid ABC transporter permease [Hyphomicrobiales bacterium]|nr:branched-chain amino acid ABC transporter permease [Hyphomicrobiales bacterium]
MDFFYVIVIMVGIYVILATSFNFVIGYGGLISVAHPAFFALGAYASGILARDLGWPVLLTMPIGALFAFASSLLISLPSLRVSGDYLMIASIGFQLGLVEVIKHVSFTGGPGGLTAIPQFLVRDYGTVSYVIFTLVIAVAVVLVTRRIVNSDYGRAISALRDDELAFATLGKNAMWLKIWVIALASGLAGLAGAIYAHYFRFVAPEQFEVLQSAAMLTMVVVGGMRTIWGPVIGAILLQTLPQAITFINLPPSILGPLQGLLFTGVVLLFMFFRPAGLIPAPAIWQGGTSAPIDRKGKLDVRGA